jgi:mRNA-degrading endonuclease toxin of MazEF toxin-antitoxin module
MNRGDIYLVSLDPSMGHEQQGTRPVLIVSPESFNKFTKTPLVVPITTGGNFARMAGFTVALVGSKTSGVARCDQPRVLDLRSRKAKKLESVSKSVMDDVLAKLATLIT